MWIQMYLSMYTWINVFICVCINVYMYVSMYACIYLVVTYSAWATLVWSCLRIYICPLFIDYLPSSPFPSVHFKYLYFSGESCTLLLFKQIPFCIVCLCPLKYITFFFSLLGFFYQLLNKLYIVTKYSLSLFLY